MENLSGGNQQKVLLAKWLATDPRVLVLDEPTIGIDVGRSSNPRLIRSIADRGVSVLLVTSEIEELEKLCDRVLVCSVGGSSGPSSQVRSRKRRSSRHRWEKDDMEQAERAGPSSRLKKFLKGSYGLVQTFSVFILISWRCPFSCPAS